MFEFTGSVRVQGGVTGSLFGTSSWAVSASWAPSGQSDTASYVTGSNVYGPFGSNSIRSASFAATASSADSFIIRSDVFEFTGSVRVQGSITGSLLGTASFATTASYALNAGSAFPFSGSAVITGSLVITGSSSSTSYLLNASGTSKLTTIHVENLKNPDPLASGKIDVFVVGNPGDAGYQKLSILAGGSPYSTVLRTSGAGGGSRGLLLDASGPGGELYFGTSDANRWLISSTYNVSGSGHIFPIGDALYDIGNPTAKVANYYGVRSYISNLLSVTGSVLISGSSTITGSLRVSDGITGSLFGTASWARSSSFALTASFINPIGTNAFVQGGNSFGTTALLGTNDANSLILETNGTARVAILSGGNVGVNNINPQHVLHISSSSGPTVMVQSADNTGGQFRAKNTAGEFVKGIEGSTQGGWMDYDVINSQYVTLYRTGSSGFYSIYTNGGERITVKGDGSVGIGTTSPTARLDVASSTTGTTMVVGRLSGHPNIKANTDAGGYLILDSNGDAAAINHYVASNVWLATGGGNVGINTTSPTVKLDVAGTTGVTTQIRTNGADWVTGLKIQANNADGGYFYTTFVSGSQYASLQAGDNITYRNISLNHQGGNVGIGITTPATKLHIQGSHTTALFRLYSTGGDGTGGTGPASVCMWASEPGVTYNGSGIGANINNSPYYGRLDSSNGQSYMRFTPADIQFYTGAGDASFRATILSTGQFGIGTTSPQKPFEVISDSNDFVSVGVNQIASGSWTGIHFGYREANNLYRKSAIVFERTDLTSTDAQGKVHILNGPQGSSGNATLSDAKITIAENGNVGIGTRTPTYKLDIVGGGVGTTAGNQSLVKRLYASTSNNDYLEITNTRVSNGSTWETSGFRIQQKVDATFMGYIQFNGDNNGGISFGTGTDTGGPLNVTEKVRITGAGNVGVGTTGPSYPLDVLGTIRATGDVIAYSDARVKDNVLPIENALEKVISLRGVSYTRKDTDDKSRKLGVIAQELLPIIPEVVSKDQHGNYSVAYGNIVGLLIEAIKEQQQQIEELKYLLENKKKKK